MQELDLRKRNDDLLGQLKTAESERHFTEACLNYKVLWERSTLKRVKRAAELQVRARLQMQKADRVMSHLGLQLNLASGEDIEEDPKTSFDDMQDESSAGASDMAKDSSQNKDQSPEF